MSTDLHRTSLLWRLPRLGSTACLSFLVAMVASCSSAGRDNPAADDESSDETSDEDASGTSNELDDDSLPSASENSDSEDSNADDSDGDDSDEESSTSEDSDAEDSDEDDTDSEDSDESTDDENDSTDDMTDDSHLPDDVPPVTGTCPNFAAGDLEFSPSGLSKTRRAKIWRSAAADQSDGPLVFYWHGTGSSPDEAEFGLGEATIKAITERGGVVVAPYADPDAGTFPWFLVSANREDDLVLADEILACAQQEVGIDLARIHTLGMSAGGLHASQMSFRRANYLASAVIYSGGLAAGTPPNPNPANKFAAMIFHGGKDDVVVIGFQAASERYLMAMQDNDQFGFICDHGKGHKLPSDANASVWQFFQDHPYGTVPDPYEDMLPSGFPDYCSLPK